MCQTFSNELLTETPHIRSYENVQACSRQWAEYGEGECVDLSERQENVSSDELALNAAMYHRDCYQNLTNVSH